MTFRDLVIAAVEDELREPKEPFVLRDASAGYTAERVTAVSSRAVNEAIDALREERPQT